MVSRCKYCGSVAPDYSDLCNGCANLEDSSLDQDDYDNFYAIPWYADAFLYEEIEDE